MLNAAPLQPGVKTAPRPSAMPSSKFNVPGAHGALIERSGISAHLQSGAAARLILVWAPAGFGKTTAMRQAYQHFADAGVAVGWITLDAADNDVPRFLDCLSEAMARMQLHDDIMPDRTGDALDLLASEQSPFALFLDDFEVLREPAVLGVVREAIAHLPRDGRLVIGSRSLPDLGIGRLRVRGQLLEIGAEQLRFDLAETAAYLSQRNVPPISAEALAQLHGKTEGWVAGLLLASMALDTQENASAFLERLSGVSGPIADYLTDDVLSNQPADVREFLLRTSILRQLSPPLCQALLPHLDCAKMLRQLHTSSLFLSPVDTGQGELEYRFHSLFTTFLRGQLHRDFPDELPRLHLSASAWYETAGRPVPAIDHAIDGGDVPRAIELLATNAQRFLEQGRMRLLTRWFGVLPQTALETQPVLQAISVWAFVFTQGPQEALIRLNSDTLADSHDPVVRAHVNAARPILLAMQDRYDEAYEAGHVSLAKLPTAVPFADTLLINCMAHITAVMGAKHETHRLLDAARRAQADSIFNRMYTESTEGLLDLEQGRLRQATARFRVAVGTTSRTQDYSHTSGNAWAGVLYALTLYDANQFDMVERLLNVYLPLARDAGLPDHMIASHAMRSRLAFWRGDVDGALRVLIELETLGHLRELPRVAAAAKLERARTQLLQGNAHGARNELDRADDPELWERVRRQRLPVHEASDLLLLRHSWEVRFGDIEKGVRNLAVEISEAVTEGRLRRARKRRVVQAIGLWRMHKLDACCEVMQSVLQDGSREGYIRMVVDEGPLVAGPIHEAAQRMRSSRATQDPVLLEYTQRLLDILGPDALAASMPSAPAEEAPWHVEPLTQKEIQVLKLLAEGYSNSAMAEKLFVSNSTVRTHLRNINMKLAAQNRTQAVSLARRYGLLR